MNSLDMSVGLKVCAGVGVQVGTVTRASTAFNVNATPSIPSAARVGHVN